VIKLPQNPKERKKVIAILCVGAIGILYLVFAFGLQPYIAGMQTRKARIAELEDSIWRAQKDLNSMDSNIEKNALLVKELLAISESRGYILRPSLGNYLLVANGILRSAADGLPILMDGISEASQGPTGKQDKDGKKSPETARFAPYTVNLTINGGMHGLSRFLRNLESGNPYVAVTRLAIMGQGETDPETHYINLNIQWPIWVDNDHPRRLEAEQIADEERQ